MLVYLFLIFICVICGLLIDKSNNESKKYTKLIMFIAFLSLFLISGLRYDVGQDYMFTYVPTFNAILNGAENVRSDLGFYWLNKIVIFFTDNCQWIFVITSFIINLFVCKSIFEQSKRKALSLFIYICGTFYFFSMNGVRQSIAISIFYFSLKYIKDKNFVKFLLLNLIGFLFHNSAIIFICSYFVLGRNYSKKFKFLVILATIFGMSFLLPIIYNFLLGTKYAMYITNGAYSALSTLNFSSIINIILFIIYEFKLKEKNKMDIIYSNCHFVGVIVSLFLTSIPLSLRIFVGFRFIEFLSVPHLLNRLSLKGKNHFIYLAIYILYFIYFVYGVLIENGNNVLPYQTIFFK